MSEQQKETEQAFFRHDTSFEERLDYRLKQAGVLDPSQLHTEQDRQEQYDRLIAMTGNTPFTRHENPNGLILVKRLSQNPSECHYDRVYLETLRKLEAYGVIWPSNMNYQHDGQRVELIELTSGSAGISFGFATKMMGFDGTLFVPSEVEKPRVHPMEAMGLNIVKTPPGYVKAASEELSAYIESLKSKGYSSVRFRREGDRSLVYEKGDHRVCIVNHSENQTTIDAFEVVGHEMAEYLPDGAGPDYLVVIMGNFTSTTGIASVLKDKYHHMKVIGLESTENPNHYTFRHPGSFEDTYHRAPTFEPTRIYGTSQRGVPLHFKDKGLALIDEIKLFDPDEAIKYQQRYNRTRGWWDPAESIGRTTAAELVTAEALDAEHPGAIIMTINYDKGDRYDELVVPTDGQPSNLIGSQRPGKLIPATIQPLGYRQERPVTPLDIPANLREAYFEARYKRAA